MVIAGPVGWALRCALTLLASAVLFGAGAKAECGSLLPGKQAPEARGVTARDIIELREIGYPDASLVGASPLSASPDGSRIALILSRADVATNSYCRGLVVAPVEGGEPRSLDTGGDFISLGNFVRGLWVETGFPKLVIPTWSPDGRFIAYIKREQGISQAAIVRADGSRRAVVTRLDGDVEELWWNSSGRLLAETRPGMRQADAEIAREGESGWLYGGRMAPNYGPRPRIRPTDAPLALVEIDPATGDTSPAPAGESRPIGGAEAIAAVSGGRVWLEPTGPSPFAPRRLWAKDGKGRKRPCASEHCSGRFLGIWWDPKLSEVRFLRREGWNQEDYVLYRWRLGSGSPVRTVRTTDVIQNCVPAGANLACTLESSSRPPRLILLDPRRGSWRTLFNPNPEFDRLRLGTVTRLRFRNARGLEAWGDLVLPPDLPKGKKLPLILVQYNSRGFLRGGTGNEYPVFPLAARGFAVLSFERPPAVASGDPSLRTDVELNAANEKGWAERRSVHSAILAAVDAAIATGVVDPDRIAITGLSDGATSVRFALINSKRFAAAAISSCCLEPKTVMTYGGIAWAEFNRAIGYPPATADAPQFWAPMSIAQNAEAIRTPLLMQLSDDEYLLSLEAFEALREKGAPVELYVFPGEHHVKWQPLHKLALSERTADWFSFWLGCEEDPDPAKAPQYRRWERMRSDPRTVSVRCAADLNRGSAPSSPHQRGA